MRHFLEAEIRRFLIAGQLTVLWPDGRVADARGAAPGPHVTLRVTDSQVARRVLLHPGLALGQAYMDGTVVPVDGSIYDVLDLLMLNIAAGGTTAALRMHAGLGVLLRRAAQFNPVSRARRNVAHHYDLNGRLYSLFLDRDRQYSCGYFPTGGETLDEAQTLKKRHIASKLKLDRPGLEVLDIGCGWGGLALTLAREYGARVTGITLSTEQLTEARARAQAEGLADRVRFELLDYRTLDRAFDRPFDRIVSVGMFEHVGLGHYRRFFGVIRRCLAPDGVALVHTIGRNNGPSATNPWLARYIFPGGYSPALSEIMPAVEASGLVTADIEVLRLHYAETLRHWRRRFAANRDAIASLYDDRFCRMFEFYLAGSELAFRHQGHVNFQIQLTRDVRTLPLARDYITDADRAGRRRALPFDPAGAEGPRPHLLK